jgi:hypothetical protein
MLCCAAGFMTRIKIEQRINLKFLVELEKKKTPTECFQLLKEVYGDNVMSHEFLNGTDDSWKVGRKWKTMNVRDALRHQKLKKILKSVKLFGKIDI